MKEIPGYSVPENKKELKGLVGRNVGVRIEGGCPRPMPLSDIYERDGQEEYEFLEQVVQIQENSFDETDPSDYFESKTLTRRINGRRYLDNDVFIGCDNVDLHGVSEKIITYKPGDPEYNDKLGLLITSKLWRTPKS